MTLQYDQPNINLQGAQAVSTLSFDSNATEQTDIIFNNWSTLLAKTQEIPGIKDIIIATGSNVIPAGIYDMTDIRLIGESAFAVLDITDAVFQNLEYIESVQMGSGLTAANTVSSFQYNNGLTNRLTMVRSSIVTGIMAAFPIVDITAGSSLALFSSDSNFVSTNVAVPVFHVDATSVLTGGAFGGASGSGWGGGNGDPAFVVVDVGGAFTLTVGTGDVFWAANQVTGPTTVVREEDYESAVVADWSAVEPLNVKNALDRLAAAVGPVA